MTNQEAIKIAQGLITDFKCEDETMVEFCSVVIEALKQMSVLDKIVAEVQSNRDDWIKGLDPEWHAYDRCLGIIDKYRKETEQCRTKAITNP